MGRDRHPNTNQAVDHARSEPLSGEALALLRKLMSGLRYGDVRVTVQDGVVVQIERTERHRPLRNE